MDGIKRRRQQLGMTQVELAKSLNVTQPTVASWESGKYAPSSRELPNIAKVLCCEINDLYAESDNPESE